MIMERKIGEIFEYNGEWYQCVNGECKDCDFSKDTFYCKCLIERDFCKAKSIFKKLEKVGEPITVKGRTFQKLIVENYSCPNCVFYIQSKECYKNSYIDGPCYNNDIWVEIKQNKEDMEEKKQCGDNRFRAIARAKEHLFQATNIAEDKKELEVLDRFLLRCWQMGWLDKYDDTKHSNSESIGKNLKPFDLETAKAGKPVCTRDGRKARIICFDFQSIENTPIVAVVQVTDKQEVISHYYEDGRQFVDGISELDLMMLPEKKEGWILLRKDGCVFDNEEVAKKNCTDDYFVAKVEWEE